jgi:hypothetical protein
MSTRDDPLHDFADFNCDALFDSDADSDDDRNNLDCDDSDLDDHAHSVGSPQPAEPVPDEWVIPHKFCTAIIRRQMNIAANPNTKVSDAIAAARCLITMNGQTLAARSMRLSQQPSQPGNANGLSSSPEQREREIDSLFDRIASEERSAAHRATWPTHAGLLADAFEDLPDAEGAGRDEAP